MTWHLNDISCLASRSFEIHEGLPGWKRLLKVWWRLKQKRTQILGTSPSLTVNKLICQFCEYIHKFTDLFNLKASKSILKARYSLLFLQHVRGKAHCLHLIGTFKVLVANGDIPRRTWLKRSPNIILLASSWVSAALWSLCIFLGHTTPRACGSRTFWLSGADYGWTGCTENCKLREQLSRLKFKEVCLWFAFYETDPGANGRSRGFFPRRKNRQRNWVPRVDTSKSSKSLVRDQNSGGIPGWSKKHRCSCCNKYLYDHSKKCAVIQWDDDILHKSSKIIHPANISVWIYLLNCLFRWPSQSTGLHGCKHCHRQEYPQSFPWKMPGTS